MMIRFNFLGYTVASVDVDLDGLIGGQSAPALVAVQRRPPIVNTVVKGMSDWWVGRMMSR